MLTRSQVLDYVSEWMPEWQRNRERVDALDVWYRGEQATPKGGKNPTVEYKALRRIALSPHLRLGVNVVAQGLVVDLAHEVAFPQTGGSGGPTFHDLAHHGRAPRSRDANALEQRGIGFPNVQLA